MVGIVSEEGIIYAGLDESNHGHFPETFALTLSGIESDFGKARGLWKRRKPSERYNVIRQYRRNKRDYTYLISMRSDVERIPRRDFLGRVLVNLFRNTIDGLDFERIKILVDGDQQKSIIQRAKGLLCGHYSLERPRVSIAYGSQLDLTRPIVNAADAIAHYYRAQRIMDVTKDSHHREFYYKSS